MARGGSAGGRPVSAHRWLVALAVPLLVLFWDPPTPGGNIVLGVGEPPCLAGEEHRWRGKRGRGVSRD